VRKSSYERLRSTQITQTERDELGVYQIRANIVITIPGGVDDIEEFPKKHG